MDPKTLTNSLASQYKAGLGILRSASLTNWLLRNYAMNCPTCTFLSKSITEVNLLNKIKDNDFLNFCDSNTKYFEFIKRYPEFAQQIPQQYIASYLKITPQSLSRIRKELSVQSEK